MAICGIYSITSSTGKIYIGSSVDVKRRWRTHLRDLRNAQHANNYLQRTYAKYGEAALTFAVQETCERADLLIREQWHIDMTLPDRRLNLAPQAGGGCGPHTTESRRKIGERHAGRVHTEQSRTNMAAAHSGKKQSPETVAKRAAAQKGRKHTAEARQKMSDALRLRFESPAFRAKHIDTLRNRPAPSSETRDRMRQAKLGKKRPEWSATLTGQKRVENGSPYAGVALVGTRWVAQVKYKGKTKHVGAFDSAECAHDAREAFLAHMKAETQNERK